MLLESLRNEFRKELVESGGSMSIQRLDIASHYLLFSLVKERLPRRAKLLFAAEDYRGKKEMIEEVMCYWLGRNDSPYVA